MRFVQARNYTRTSGRKIAAIIVHTMEYPERPTGAEWAAKYFRDQPRHNPPKSYGSSAHYSVDSDSEVQSVRDQDVAWAAPGKNHDGIQIEHAGYAAQGKPGWADPYSQAMLRRSAKLVARLCRHYSIPVRWLSVADLKAGRRGITSHANVSKAFKRSTHWDPGPDFPVGLYLRWVKEELPEPKIPHRKVKKGIGTGPVIANTPLEEAIRLLEESKARKRGHRRIVEALKLLKRLRKRRGS